MNATDQLREALTAERDRLRANLPANRVSAVAALVQTIDALPDDLAGDPRPDLVTGRHVPALGANLALQLCLEAAPGANAPVAAEGEGLVAWARGLLADCARLVAAEMVLAHVETGFMRLIAGKNGTFVAWAATRQVPVSWRERADIDWWAAWLSRRNEPELRAIVSAPRRSYRRLANVHLAMMDYQLGYPPDAVLSGCAVQAYRDVLGALIARALAARDRGEGVELPSKLVLVENLARELDIAEETVATALDGFTLGPDNAAFHAAPGAALPPLVQAAPDRLLWSWRGLTTEPFFFLIRELRRRDAQGYHNSAHLRERVFRDDLYALFADKRFITSAGRIVLRRAAGEARTDIDAAVFDRKSGALALFELKSHDPFARSPAELARQRDNVLYANRQIGGVLDWVTRHGGDEILNRIDPRAARTFRVQKVHPFVLGRFLVHFNDGPRPDQRAAWATWPQLLHLRDGQPFSASDSHPLGTLFTRLRSATSPILLPGDAEPCELVFGATRLHVFPSYGAVRASVGEAAGDGVTPS